MRRILVILLPMLATFGCASDVTAPADLRETRQTVVYGDDDRTDWYAHPDDAWRDLTEASIVALIRPGNVDESDPSAPRIRAARLQDARDLCDDQRFLDHPAAANCSGTLIDDDLVITAGHCVDDLADCRNYRFVFDFLYEAEGELRPLTAEDVYQCEALLVQRNVTNFDYAIVQLDRPVVGHSPAPVRVGDAAVEVGAPMTVIGFGSGIPAKIDTGGVVTNPRAGTLDWFGATLDTFGGNSGSGVFDASGELVGMLVRGERDYVSRGGCTVVNELAADGSDGDEDVSYAYLAIDDLCESGHDTPLCAGRVSWCGPCASDADCRPGFVCAPTFGGATRCTSRCMSDADCRDDHTCAAGGLCAPNPARFCLDGSPTTGNVCGDVAIAAPACPTGTRCEGGDCVDVGAGETCETAIAIEPVSSTLTGSLVDTTNDHEGSCAGAGPERVYVFDLPRAAVFSARASGFDTTLYLRGDPCDDPASELVCNDDIGRGDRGSRIEADLEPGTWYLFMDAYQERVGEYELEVTFETGCDDACGPGATRCAADTVEVCEVGDDGCGVWVDFEVCEVGEFCSGGRCLRRCSDTCSPAGSRICVGDDAWQACRDDDGDGCVEWSVPVDCDPGQTCAVGGVCAGAEPDAGPDADPPVDDVGFDVGPPPEDIGFDGDSDGGFDSDFDARPPPPVDGGFDTMPPVDVGTDTGPVPPTDAGTDTGSSDAGVAADSSSRVRIPIEREGRPRRPPACAAASGSSSPVIPSLIAFACLVGLRRSVR